jgi:hypothetical protein
VRGSEKQLEMGVIHLSVLREWEARRGWSTLSYKVEVSRQELWIIGALVPPPLQTKPSFCRCNLSGRTSARCVMSNRRIWYCWEICATVVFQIDVWHFDVGYGAVECVVAKWCLQPCQMLRDRL